MTSVYAVTLFVLTFATPSFYQALGKPSNKVCGLAIRRITPNQEVKPPALDFGRGLLTPMNPVRT
jgi:hypothetical protein